MLFECVVGKMFCCVLSFSFPAGVYVGTLNLMASIPDPSILTFYLYNFKTLTRCRYKDYNFNPNLTKYIKSCLENKCKPIINF